MQSIIVMFFCGLALAECARILVVVPFPAISHQVVFRPITQELARRGHRVVVITTDPAFPAGAAPPGLVEIDVGAASYSTWRERRAAVATTTDLYSHVSVVQPLVLDIFMDSLETPEVQNLIKNETFDLLLLEAFIRPPLLFTHFFKVPAVHISSFGGYFDNFEIMGAPTHQLAFPSMASRKKLNNLSVWDKITELYHHYRLENLFMSFEESEEITFRKRYGPGVPSMRELKKNVDLLMLNVHPIWESNRPVPPNIVFIGGVHEKPINPLPEDLESYLNSSKTGIVYVSFGTNVNPALLPPRFIQVLKKTLTELPYDVLWKWDKDELLENSSHIKMAKWLPQSDLLKHPNIKVYVMQGGLQSTDEAILAGVPLVCIPNLGDQWYNAEKYEALGMGIHLDRDTLTPEILRNAIDTVFKDDSYRLNIKKFRALLHDQPQKALERAVWWIEHVLRHGGGRHLRPATYGMSWTEFLLFDVLLLLLGAIAAVTALLVLLFKYLIRPLFNVINHKVKNN